MPSNIDPNFIGTGPVSKNGMKQQLAHARDEINALETQVQARLPLSGGTMTGPLALHANPTAALHASPKQYVDAVAAALADARVAKTGDTMTGNLNINRVNPQLLLQYTSPTFRAVVCATNVSPRWAFGADSAAEYGGDTGSDFVLNRYNDFGFYLGTSLSITRSNGQITLSSPLPIAGPWAMPTAANHLATKGYVDSVNWSESGNIGASGNAVGVIGIPSDVREIIINFLSVSTNGTQPILVQTGNSSGYAQSGYVSSSMRAGGTTVACAGWDSGFLLNTNNASATMSGFVHLTRFSPASTGTWQAIGMVTFNTTGAFLTTTGRVSMPLGPLDRVRVLCFGSDVFDDGVFNFMWRT